MSLRTKIEMGAAIAFVAALVFIGFQSKHIQDLQGEGDRYRKNTEALMSDVQHYRTGDSLNAARVQALELTAEEFERFRAEDAALIKSLQAKNRDLAAMNRMQSQTIIELAASPRDTVIVRDSVQVPAVALHCGDAWFDFDGILTKTDFTGRLEHRDSLVLVETVKYRRFLGFLWKTKRIEDMQLDCVTKSPYNTIVGLERIVIEK